MKRLERVPINIELSWFLYLYILEREHILHLIKCLDRLYEIQSGSHTVICTRSLCKQTFCSFYSAYFISYNSLVVTFNFSDANPEYFSFQQCSLHLSIVLTFLPCLTKMWSPLHLGKNKPAVDFICRAQLVCSEVVLKALVPTVVLTCPRILITRPSHCFACFQRNRMTCEPVVLLLPIFVVLFF